MEANEVLIDMVKHPNGNESSSQKRERDPESEPAEESPENRERKRAKEAETKMNAERST